MGRNPEEIQTPKGRHLQRERRGDTESERDGEKRIKEARVVGRPERVAQLTPKCSQHGEIC